MHGLNQYKKAQMDTVSAEDSIVLIFDGTRRFVDRALAALQTGDLEGVCTYAGKAQQVLSELSLSLNRDAGDMAANLEQLYEYWGWRLSQGVIKKDPAAFQEVSAVLVDMRDAWAEAAKQVRAQRKVLASG